MTETYEFKENYNHRKIKRKIDKPSQIVYTPKSEMELNGTKTKSSRIGKSMELTLPKPL